MCVFLFFFFKQKTAYELRISDWSSDVCSSDLLELCHVLEGHQVNRHRFGYRHLERCRRKREQQPRREQRVQTDRCDEAALHRRPATSTFPEIGRASCRERVCQYV